MSSELRIEAREDLAALEPVWTELEARAGNLFLTWAWASTWLRHFGGGGRPLALVCREPGGEAAAILPLMLARRGPLRVARFIGHGPADQLGPVAAPGDPRPAGALLDSSAARWDVLLAERMPPEAASTQALGGSVVNREGSPVIDLRGLDWDGYLATRSPKLRGQIRRMERKLEREQGLAYRMTDDPDRLDADFDELMRLHRLRFGGESVEFPAQEEFHRDFARVALARGWLRLWIAEVGGRPAAAWYGFRYGDADWYYQSGRDPQWERYGIGVLLVAHTIRCSTEDGLSGYKLLRGDEAYKSRLMTADPGLVTVAVGRGAAGRSAVRVAGRVARSDGPLRSLLRRVAG